MHLIRPPHMPVLLTKLVIAMALFLALTACDQNEPDAACQPCSASSTRFIETLASGQTQEAFDTLFAHSLLNNRSLTSNQFIKMTNGLLRQYQDIASYEHLGTEKSGRIVAQSFLIYQEKGASRWVFYYYLSPESGKWLLLDLNASDQAQYLMGKEY